MQDEIQIRIEFSPLFNRKLKQLPRKIIAAFDETLELFWEDLNHKHLRRHFLGGKFSGYESIDVTEDYRAVFMEEKIKNGTIIKFHVIGTHKDLYTS